MIVVKNQAEKKIGEFISIKFAEKASNSSDFSLTGELISLFARNVKRISDDPNVDKMMDFYFPNDEEYYEPAYLNSTYRDSTLYTPQNTNLTFPPEMVMPEPTPMQEDNQTIVLNATDIFNSSIQPMPMQCNKSRSHHKTRNSFMGPI